MATIIYLKDNGESQVLTEITNIAQMGIDGDSNSQELAKYIRQGLDQLSTVGVPANKQLLMYSHETNGDPRTFHILKELKGCSCPLNEFRINRSEPGAFRAIFFEYEYEGEQFLVFTKAVLKQGDRNPPELQTAIKQSEILYQDFHQNPDSHLRKDE
ncbi:hypothetical protein [Bacillus thermotolerans]|uniref:hypothetical protein n=1 Tax=Bacillus thermotolerans TaxID=1221996 RepID=UPI000588FFED|nr:hypothetical protein [Bacillus thermotolerans]